MEKKTDIKVPDVKIPDIKVPDIKVPDVKVQEKKERIEIIIAHYNEDLNWTKDLKYKYRIISKHGIPSDVSPNKGFEAFAYLQYIIENYDSLPDFLICLHGHRNCWHHKQNMDERLATLEFKYPYCNINEPKLGLLISFKESYDQMKLMIPEIEKILNMSIPLDKLIYKCSAQFYVTKKAILRNEKRIYVDLYNYLMNSKYPSFWTSRVFEYIWHILLPVKL
jgi:hypothetical protein